jgi:hypothetical protein
MWRRFKAWLKRQLVWDRSGQPTTVRVDPNCIGYCCTTEEVEICFTQANYLTISMGRRELRRFITQLAIMVTDATPLDEHIRFDQPFSQN